MSITQQDQELFPQAEAEILPHRAPQLSQRAIDRQKRMASRTRAQQGATYGWQELAPEFGEREVWE